MSFIGAVATSVRQVLAQYAKDVHLPCLIVGAGNFTVPSVLRSAGFAGTITACDVTLYTSALGAYLSGWTLEAREREDCPEHLRGLLRTGSPLELTASISLLMDLREVWKGDNAFKMRMVEHRGGEWRERTSGLELMAHVAAHRPVKVGFHIPAWLSYFVSLSEVAHAWLKYKESGKLDDLKNFRNQYAAEPWVESHAARSEDAILALCDDRPRGKVPGPVDGKERVSVLLATVDTQQHYFRYVIRAYGYGETEESWIVASGSADNLAALEEILFGSVYADPDGREYAVKAAMIDAMGGRTAEVYRWAVRHRGRVFPWQGVRSMAQPYTPSHQEYFPDAKGNKVKIPGGLMLYRCDVTFFKSDLAFKLGIHPDDPGAFHLHANDGGQLEQYAKELCAEVWDDEKQGWENPANKPNHFWDCEVMQRAFAFILNVRHRRRPGEEAKKPARPPRPSERGGGGIGSRLANLRRS